MMENFIGKKEKWTKKERKKNAQIHELIGNMWLILCYTVQLVIPDVCTKFQNPKSSSFREIFDRKKLYRLTDKHSYRKGKNYIPPIYFVCRGYKHELRKVLFGLYALCHRFTICVCCYFNVIQPTEHCYRLECHYEAEEETGMIPHQIISAISSRGQLFKPSLA